MHIQIPPSLELPDGTRASVRAVFAKVADGLVTEIVYTVEMPSGAWVDIAAPPSVLSRG